MIDFTSLSIGYNKRIIVSDLSAHISEGDSVAIIGPNGGGKSTLLKTIASILTPISGTISCKYDKSHIAYLSQLAEINTNFPITTYEFVAMGLWHKTGWFKSFAKNDKHKILHAIEAVGLLEMVNAPIKSLSGGQIQRARFARVILQDAPLILLDEPFNAIDFKTIQDLFKIISFWKKEKKTIIAVLHNYDEVKQLFEKTMVVSRKLIAYGKTEEVLVPEVINKAFQHSFF